MSEEIIAKLRRENAKLYGKLGAQGLALNREKKIKDLQQEIENLTQQLEDCKLEKSKLKIDLTSAALQGLMANPNIIGYSEMVAIAQNEREADGSFIMCCASNIADKLAKHIFITGGDNE